MSVFCDKDADLTPEFTTECYIRRKFIAEGKIPQGEEKANTILCRTASASSRAPVAQRRLAVQSLPNRECIRIPQARRHGIVFDVFPNSLKMRDVPNPMVKRFVLPECSSRAP